MITDEEKVLIEELKGIIKRKDEIILELVEQLKEKEAERVDIVKLYEEKKEELEAAQEYHITCIAGGKKHVLWKIKR